MGFFNKPWKAIKGTINKIPGGKHLTGKAKERQKRLYNEASSNYQNYATEAKTTIETLSKQLAESKNSLRNLEQSKYQHQYKGQQLQGELSNYAHALQGLESHKAKLEGEANSLTSKFSAFKSKLPELEGGILEMQQSGNDFEDLFNSIKEQKESLKGLSREEAGKQHKKHHQDVENLKIKRADAENRIKEQLSSITARHTGLAQDKQQLEYRLDSYRSKQEAYQAQEQQLNQQRNSIEQMLGDYKREASSINSQYENSKLQTQNYAKQLETYAKDAQGKLNQLGDHLEWRTKKYRQEANRTGIVQGIGLGLLSFGAGGLLASPILTGAGTMGSVLSTLGTGLRYASPIIGMMKYGNTANIEHKLKNIEKFDLRDIMADLPSMNAGNYNNIQGQKMSIPELGGLKQSLSHFNMPQVPQLKDLPTLHESLGKIVSPEDIKGLTLGLPKMASASGKKYSAGVLYDPSFLKKLKKLSKRIGTPYLNSGSLGSGNIQQGVVYG